MPAPVKFGPADVYYVAPPDIPSNAFSELWHGFHQVRNPYMQTAFNSYLAEQSPKQQYAVLAELYKRRASLLEAAAKAEKDSQAGALAGDRNQTQIDVARIYAEAGLERQRMASKSAISVAEIGADKTRREQGELKPANQAALDTFKTELEAGVNQLNSGNAREGATGIDQATRNAALFHDQLVQQGDALQADAFARQINALSAQNMVSDSELGDQVRAGIRQRIPPPAQYAEVEAEAAGYRVPTWWHVASSPGGPGRAPPSEPSSATRPTGGGSTAGPPSLEQGVRGSGERSPFPAGAAARADAGSGASPGTYAPITQELLAGADRIGKQIEDLQAQGQGGGQSFGDYWSNILGETSQRPRPPRPKPEPASIAAQIVGPPKAPADTRTPRERFYDQAQQPRNPVPELEPGTPRYPRQPAGQDPYGFDQFVPQLPNAGSGSRPAVSAAAAPSEATPFPRVGPAVGQAFRQFQAENPRAGGVDFPTWYSRQADRYIAATRQGFTGTFAEWASVNVPGYSPGGR